VPRHREYLAPQRSPKSDRLLDLIAEILWIDSKHLGGGSVMGHDILTVTRLLYTSERTVGNHVDMLNERPEIIIALD
jgi:hypothetical protein